MAMGSPGRRRRKPKTTTEAATTTRTVWASRAPRKRRMGSGPTILAVSPGQPEPTRLSRLQGLSLTEPGVLEEEHRQGIELEPLDSVADQHVELELREGDHRHVLVDLGQCPRVRLGPLRRVELLAALVQELVDLGVGVPREIGAPLG